MTARLKAYIVYNYLEKNNFDIQNVGSNIRDLMFDKEVLKELNKILDYENQIFYVKDVLLLELIDIKKEGNKSEVSALERFLGEGQKRYTLLKTTHVFGTVAYNPDTSSIKTCEDFYKNHKDLNQNRKIYQLTDNDTLVYSFDRYAKIDDVVVREAKPLQNFLSEKLDFITRDQLHYLQKIIAFQDKVNELER